MKYAKLFLKKVDLIKVILYVVTFICYCISFYIVVIGLCAIWSNGNHELIIKHMMELKFIRIYPLYIAFFLLYRGLLFLLSHGERKIIDVSGSTIAHIKKCTLLFKTFYNNMKEDTITANITDLKIKKLVFVLLLVLHIVVLSIVIGLIIFIAAVCIQCIKTFLMILI